MRASKSMYSSGGDSFGLMGQSSSLLGAQEKAPLSLDGVLEQAGRFGPAQKQVDLSQPYQPPSMRQREQVRSNMVRSGQSSISEEVLNMVHSMSSKPSLVEREGGALESKQVDYESYQDFLFRDAKRTPEERRALYRIRQPMSPMLHSMIKQKEMEAQEESKPVSIPVSTQHATPYREAVSQLLQALQTPDATKKQTAPAPAPATWPAVAETLSSRVWQNRVFLFDFEHPAKAPANFSFSLDFCERHSVDNIDADCVVEVELPPVEAQGVPWVRIVMVALETGAVTRLWCPMHDGRGNRFLGNVQRVTDHIAQVSQYFESVIAPLVARVQQLEEQLQQ